MSDLASVVANDCPGALPGLVVGVDGVGGGSDGAGSAGGAEVTVRGVRTLSGEPMTRDTVFRIASVTKPLLAAATLAHIERGTVALADEAVRWLPELADAEVLRDPHGPLDHTVPARAADHGAAPAGIVVGVGSGVGFLGAHHGRVDESSVPGPARARGGAGHR